MYMCCDSVREIDLSPYSWVSDLVVQNSSCLRELTLSFQLAPATYKFNIYQVFCKPSSRPSFSQTIVTVNNSQLLIENLMIL